jgi:poly(A) polymerase
MRLEQDPIHRHKDVLTHTLAVVENVRPDAAPELRLSAHSPAALFHDVGKPQTRGYPEGKGVTFHHHDAVGARMTRKRLTALRYSNDDIEAITELVALHLRFPHLPDGLDGLARASLRPRCRRSAPELNVLTRCDCTTRNERKALCCRNAWTSSSDASPSLPNARSWPRSARARRTQVMEQLGSALARLSERRWRSFWKFARRRHARRRRDPTQARSVAA